ncbi:Crystal ET79 [Fusarium heterosporum]|uniref:Crystal ET79 n=1 Tax=Fusarium heterosporum TaxID=42747 RepID=A0A8H5WQB5_FUSHE|nr:Crystal ET79 [Fusarium heterosporum]
MAPSRSTHCTVVNNTPLTLTLSGSKCHHGQWTLNFGPPDTIAANGKATFQAESAGVMTGDEGYASYSSSAGTFTFRFNNPFSGSNDYDESGPGSCKIKRDGGGGDDARVTWTIEIS